MAQNYNKNSYQGDHIGDIDVANMERNFECLRSNFAGVSSPANPIGGKLWYDTNKSMKIRNYANDAWYGLFVVESNHKIYVYNNSAPDGWIIDSSVSDTVIAFKNTSLAVEMYGPYYTAGTTGGTWTLPTHNFNHNHQWYNYVSGGDDQSWDSDGITEHVIGSYNYTPSAWRVHNGITDPSYPWCYYYKPNNSYTINENITIDLGSTWRPYAAVGTLQYINV